MHIPDIDLDKIQEIADTANLHDASPRTYSGRAMFGKECLGITLDSIADFALFMVFAVETLGLDDAEWLAEAVTTDSMGRSTIYYWPALKVEG